MENNKQTVGSPASEPAFGDKFRHSKALIPTMAVLGVTVMALAAALVVSRTEAQPGGTEALVQQTQQQPAKTAQTAAAPAKRAPVVVAKAPKAEICANCGTVESVVAVERQGQVNGVAVGGTTVGLGTVAGGVVGGLLGNQVGGGNGKTAMTVLGVAGGAYAGNTIEKNMKKVTVYQTRVRMHDGSVRTLEHGSAIAAGSRVVVEGNTLRLAASASAAG